MKRVRNDAGRRGEYARGHERGGVFFRSVGRVGIIFRSPLSLSTAMSRALGRSAFKVAKGNKALFSTAAKVLASKAPSTISSTAPQFAQTKAAKPVAG